MPAPFPTEAEVDRIIAVEKRISGDIIWLHDPGHNRDWAKFNVPVENDDGLELTLYVNVQLNGQQKRSYSLFLRRASRSFRIFSLDVNGTHRNIRINDNEWNRQTHKQRWRDAYSQFAFTPSESIPEEPIAAFREFCAECNIVFTGQIGDIPTI
jgi:hypothetical protein